MVASSRRYGALRTPTRDDPPVVPEPSRVGEPARLDSIRSQQTAEDTRTAGLIRDVDDKFVVDLTNRLITMKDEQAVPVTRIRLGELGVGLPDWGIEIFDAAGLQVFSATGLGINTVGTAQIIDAAVTTPKVADLNITTIKLGNLAVDSTKLADNSVVTNKLNALAVTGAKIADVTIAGGKLIADTITANEIAALTITGAEIAALTITGGKIAANTITAGEIFANTITAAEIFANTITANEIAANTITATEIAALTITGAEILANTITAGKLNVSTLSAIAADVGTLNAGKLQNAGATVGILLSGTLPGTWVDFIDFTATGNAPFLKHAALTLEADGDADFSGVVSATTFTAANAEFAGRILINASAPFIQINDNVGENAKVLWQQGGVTHGLIEHQGVIFRFDAPVAGGNLEFKTVGVLHLTISATGTADFQGNTVSMGEVGIGLTAPQRDLHISSGVPTIRLSDSSAGTDQAVATLIELFRGESINRVGFWGMVSGTNDIMGLATDYAAGEIRLSTGNNVLALTLSSTQNAAFTGAVSMTALTASTGTFSGDLILTSSTGKIRQNTSDGADNQRITITGGGDTSTVRGAQLILYGNEHASTGKVQIVAGNIAGGTIEFYTGAAVLQLSIAANGNATFTQDLTAVDGTFSGNLTLSGGAPNAVITPGTADASDNLRIALIGGGAASTGRGSQVIVHGNENASTGQVHIVGGDVAGGDIIFFTDAGVTRVTINEGTGLVNLVNALTVGGLVLTTASATGGANFRLPHGTAPTSPVNGDMWTTTAGLFVRINGGTVGPLT